MVSFYGYNHHHVVVFSLTFLSYALLHSARKSFSNIKSTIISEWTPTNLTVNSSAVNVHPGYIWNKRHLFVSSDPAESFLGVLDGIFLGAYAIGLYISGVLGDRFNPRIVLSGGLILSAFSIIIFGSLTEWLHFYNIYFYVILWILNGLLQSTGWPSAVAIMGNWFHASPSKGLIFGFWSACASVGNIIGAYIVSIVLNFGYDFGLLIPACILISGGILIFFGLLSSPDELNLTAVTKSSEIDNEETETSRKPLLAENSDNEDEEPVIILESKAINFFSAFLLPGVLPYALSYACLKFVNYAFFFWMPFYLKNNFDWSAVKSDQISIYYDVGGIIGGIICGIISDRIWSRSPVVMTMLLLAIPSLIVYGKSPGIIWENSLLLAITGFFINGAANIISSAITADLGKQDCIRGNEEALATVTGIIDGTGSIGAAIGQVLIPVVQENLGWYAVFYMFIAMTVFTMLCILPMFIRDIKWKINQRNSIINFN